MLDPTTLPQYTALTSPTFEAAVAEARETLRVRYERLIVQWRPESYAAWSFDQNDGILRFTNPDGSGLCATGQLLGSFDPTTSSWMWSWCNDSASSPLVRRAALAAREWGAARGHAPLTTGILRGSEREVRGLILVAAVAAGVDAVYYGHAPGAPVVAIGFTGLRPIGGAAAPRPTRPANAAAARPARPGLAAYVRHPRAIYARAPQRSGAAVVPTTPELDAQLALPIRGALERMEREVRDAGFDTVVHAALRSSKGRALLIEHAGGQAIGHVLVSPTRGDDVAIAATFFSRFVDGIELQTSNFRLVGRTPSRRHVRFLRLPDAARISELWAIHAFRVAERARTVAVRPLTRGADPFAFEAAVAHQTHSHWVATGYYRWVGPDALRHTMRGATLAAWRGLFPWKQVTEWRERRAAARVLARYIARA